MIEIAQEESDSDTPSNTRSIYSRCSDILLSS